MVTQLTFIKAAARFPIIPSALDRKEAGIEAKQRLPGLMYTDEIAVLVASRKDIHSHR